MGVDLTIETEGGERLCELLDPKSYLAHALSLPGLDRTGCLRFIDLYDDTVFNQQQIPQLVAELEMLRDRVTDAGLRASAEQQVEAGRRTGWSPEVVKELEAAAKRATAGPVRKHLEAVLMLARQAQGRAHTSLKFLGD